jgi:hypothetical protein
VDKTASDETVILNILASNWAPYCQMLDTEQLHEIVSEANAGKAAQFESPRGGANFDTHVALQIATQAASLISLCLKIYSQLKQMRNTKPAPEELKTAVVQSWQGTSDTKVFSRLDSVVAAVVALR